MSDSPKNMTRKEALGGLVILPALAGFVAAGTAAAQAKSSKSSLKYQDHPDKNGHMCSGCSLFVPGKSKTAMGGCKVVEGSISPKGWCVAYSPK